MSQASFTRRRLLELSGAAGAAAFIAGCGGDDGVVDTSARDRPTPLAKTPPCEDGHKTPPQSEGPFFKPSSPERTDLRRGGAAGTPLLLAGSVVSTRCEPIAGALLDFWQADGNGAYDNEGFHLRGHQFTDRDGRFELATVVPGEYPGRIQHIHVMVQPEGGEVLTTQLYFPGSPGNEADPLFDPALLILARAQGGETRGRFSFVV